MVWQAKRLQVYLPDEQGLPTHPCHLLVARNALDPEEVKYFLSNAPASTPVETLLCVAFTRWVIERAFEDSKTELGLDHFEVRKFVSIQRYLILSCLSHIFLTEFCRKHRGENPGLTLCQVRTATATLAPLWTQGGRCSRLSLTAASGRPTMMDFSKPPRATSTSTSQITPSIPSRVTLCNLASIRSAPREIRSFRGFYMLVVPISCRFWRAKSCRTDGLLRRASLQ